MQIAVYDKDAKHYITSKSPEAKYILITLDGKIFWDDPDFEMLDMSDQLQIVILPCDT